MILHYFTLLMRRPVGSRLLKIPNVLVRFDHSARFIENANHDGMRATEKFCVTDCVADCIQSSA
jgi:hypothetical protein